MLDNCGMSAEAIRRALEFVAVAEWICIVMAITLGVPALRAPGCPRCIFGCKFVPVLSRLWLTEISYGRTLQLHKVWEPNGKIQRLALFPGDAVGGTTAINDKGQAARRDRFLCNA